MGKVEEGWGAGGVVSQIIYDLSKLENTSSLLSAL